MSRSLKKAITILLVIGGSIFVLLFDLKLALDWINQELEPKYDENGKIIYEDCRHTIASFGKRKEFDIWKSGSGDEVLLILFDRDKNEEIDVIEHYTTSPKNLIVYTIGRKGYTKLNSETAEIIQSKDINLFSEEDIKIFKELESRKSIIKN